MQWSGSCLIFTISLFNKSSSLIGYPFIVYAAHHKVMIHKFQNELTSEHAYIHGPMWIDVHSMKNTEIITQQQYRLSLFHNTLSTPTHTLSISI